MVRGLRESRARSRRVFGMRRLIPSSASSPGPSSKTAEGPPTKKHWMLWAASNLLSISSAESFVEERRKAVIEKLLF